MREILLGNGGVALVDDRDFASLYHLPWHVSHNGYAIRRERYGPTDIPSGQRKRTFYMHRVIVGHVPDGHEVDHVDGNKLNNQRRNLRLVTRTLNSQNQRPVRGGSSRFKGVAWLRERGYYAAYITKDKQRINLGYYDDEREAALAYNQAATDLFGPYACLNVLDDAAVSLPAQTPVPALLQRKTQVIVNGESMLLVRACELFGVSPDKVRKRLARGMTPEQALSRQDFRK